MKNYSKSPTHKVLDKARPDYYKTPTRDFTQYTKDCEEKYWKKETAFDWSQSVRQNLKEHLEKLESEAFSKIAFMVISMIAEAIESKIVQICQEQLPLDEDRLKDIGEYIPSERSTIQKALLIQLPLKSLYWSVSVLKDQVEILQNALSDLQEQQKLGLFNDGTTVKQLETATEKMEQSLEISKMSSRLDQIQKEFKALKAQSKLQSKGLKLQIQAELQAIQPQILTDLEETLKLLLQTQQAKQLPGNAKDLAILKELILKRQLRALKDLANYSLVVEQSAIAPLSMGIIQYKRYREIQEAMTTFINDEAKHSATFRRFLADKLEAKEFISDLLIKETNQYMWLARFMPGTGLFLAVIIEAIGAAYLEFFSKEAYMPDPLFRSICKTISEQDEKRHLDLCADMYNELFRKGNKWEQFLNKATLKVMMKTFYGDKSEDHYLVQSFRAFGIESEILYRHIVVRLSQQLARISLNVSPDKLLKYMGHK